MDSSYLKLHPTETSPVSWSHRILDGRDIYIYVHIHTHTHIDSCIYISPSHRVLDDRDFPRLLILDAHPGSHGHDLIIKETRLLRRARAGSQVTMTSSSMNVDVDVNVNVNANANVNVSPSVRVARGYL